MDLDYTFYGNIVEHPKYGTQFSVETYEIKEPNDNESLIIYLSSGLFKGIGIKTAKKIVEKFGKDTVNIIKNDYKKLSLVHGITVKQKAIKMHDKIYG
jgi:exodeoxyribonuclease V alpha subunit